MGKVMGTGKGGGGGVCPSTCRDERRRQGRDDGATGELSTFGKGAEGHESREDCVVGNLASGRMEEWLSEQQEYGDQQSTAAHVRDGKGRICGYLVQLCRGTGSVPVEWTTTVLQCSTRYNWHYRNMDQTRYGRR